MYLPTIEETSIIFCGADDSAKMKSIKVSKYPIALLWIEEAAEIKTHEELAKLTCEEWVETRLSA
ncbi:phage terminase large subunit [Priestia megaterium]|uniref:phage terminase large subunit n=1 Tax=Priestia megaterium TaxID=1404 RepID=UPI0035BE5754